MASKVRRRRLRTLNQGLPCFGGDATNRVKSPFSESGLSPFLTGRINKDSPCLTSVSLPLSDTINSPSVTTQSNGLFGLPRDKGRFSPLAVTLILLRENMVSKNIYWFITGISY